MGIRTCMEIRAERLLFLCGKLLNMYKVAKEKEVISKNGINIDVYNK